MIENQGLIIEKDYFLVCSTEREYHENQDCCTKTIPKVMRGNAHTCIYTCRALYGKIGCEMINMGKTKTAEMTRLLENVHRAVNIGLMNDRH